MTKKSKTYQLYIALLLCFFQVAGIDVYAQEPVKTVQDSISPVREAPKARARRHREPVVSSPVADSVKVDKAVILPPTVWKTGNPPLLRQTALRKSTGRTWKR